MLELQITQSSHPKSDADRQRDAQTDGLSGPTTRPDFAKALFNRKSFFHFVNVSFTLSAYYELSQSTVTLSTLFIFYDVLNAF